MYTQLAAIMLVAALATVLITSTTIALSDDADARKKGNSQSLSQSNGGGVNNVPMAPLKSRGMAIA